MSERPPISPRSPRAALEPEQVPPPPRRSERVRNPFIVVGNAVITIVLVLMIGAGGAYIYGRQKIEAPGPLQEDKIVNIPARAGMTDIADILQREGVIDNNRWAFIGSVFALKARSELKPGEYSFQKNASLRDVIGTMVEGKVVQHAVTIPEGLTSEQIPARPPPRPGDCPYAAGAEAHAGGNLGAPQPRPADQDPGTAGDAGFDRRE